MRTLTLVTALATLAGAAAAQQRPTAPQAPQAAAAPATPQPPHAPPFGGPEMRGGLALFLSSNPPALNLTADQLRRVQAANERAQTANAALRQQLQAATANRDLATLGLAERHQLMIRLRDLRRQMQDNVDSATTVAIAALNTEQQRTLQAMHQLRGGMRGSAMRPGRAMRGGMGRGRRGGMMMGPGGMDGMMGGPGMGQGMMQGRMGGMGPMGGMMGPMGPAQAPPVAQPTQRPPQ